MGGALLYTVAADIVIQQGDDAWKIIIPRKSKTLSVSAKVARIVICLAGMTTLLGMARLIRSETGFDAKGSCSLLRVFWGHGLLELSSQATEDLVSEQRRWAENGWRASHTFFSYTQGFPFENYSTNGAAVDRNRMQAYRREGSDPARTKKMPDVVQEFFAPTCKEACRNLPISASENTTKEKPALTSNALLEIAAATFGIRRTRRIKGNPDVPPLLRKTSPSGGCLHPTEGYLFLRQDLDKMPSGVYHFSCSTNSLDLFNTLYSEEETMRVFDGNFRARFDPIGIWVLTSVFELNRFLYREPRTFRTVFIDIGHILETLMLVCEAHGLDVYPHHGFDISAVENKIGLVGSDEAAIMACAFGVSDQIHHG